jgi:EAL domain-containing protein (putative c-di-GMP-specific phosphodiesterase class I)
MAPHRQVLELRRWFGQGEPPDDGRGAQAVDPPGVEQAPRIEIDEALRNGWFEIWYQPKIDLRRKCLAGAEALARIHHPVHGVLPPGTFVPDIAAGSIARLTEYTLLSALAHWSAFDEAGFNLQLAINMPFGVLLEMPVPSLVDRHRPHSENWPGIILEVTEDQIVRDMKLAQEVTAELEASGIRIAIDDFGAGYSSLSSLRQLPFVELKLHASFVNNCATDATNAAICQTAVDLAHRFGSAAVAEGIESAVDLQALMVMGCDLGQGALIAPPMPQERLLGLLQQRTRRPAADDGSQTTGDGRQMAGNG